MSDQIPEAVRKFVAAFITSIAQLEALLLLRETAPQSLSSDEVARKLYCQAEIVARQLADLLAAGLLEGSDEQPVRYVYRPASGELEEIVGQLAEIYRDRRVAVTTLIYSDSTYAMRSFADAFRFRKDTK